MDQAVASPLTPIARMRLNAELMGLVRQKQGIAPADPMAPLKAARVAAQIITLLGKLGADLSAKKREIEAFELEGGPELPAQPRTVTAKFYDFDPNRTHAQRKKDNVQAMALLRSIDAGEVKEPLTEQQREVLARYSGTGGNLVGADGKRGSAYEYYSPKPIAAGMWELLGELGFKGGKVGDPCAGVGIFGATAPANAAMETVELNETSGRINQLVNAGPGYNAIVSPFEAVASRTPDEIWDAVITNVPFGGVHDRGSNRKIDPRYQDQPLEVYFILRSLEKLKPGGLAAFIVPPRVVSAKGGREEQLRIQASYMAEFRGAYRLPNSVFGTADADTITDVIVFRKFSRSALAKIAELREQDPGKLVEANVQWTEFIGGTYFQGEGKRFVLGEFQAKDPNKFRDVDRVISDATVPNIAKLLRKFPDSRIDWKLLEAAETEPIEYRDGDTITMAGQTLEMRDGAWVALGKAAEDDRFDGLGQIMGSPVVAATNKVSWQQAHDYVQYLRDRSMEMDMPDWLRAAHRDVGALDESDKPKYWAALVAGLAAVDVTRQHGDETGFNYVEEYPAISEAIEAASATARKAPAMFSRANKGALQKVGIVYDRKGGFSALWRGEVNAEVTPAAVIGEDEKVEAIKYAVQGVTLDVEALKSVYGEQFDPLADDNWCVSADGSKATKADDYYTGNVAAFLARIDGEIATASGPVRDKLLRQKELAGSRVNHIDPTGLRFNLFSPFVGLEEKAEFLRRFMHPAFVVATNDEGEQVIICDINPKTERERQLKRFAEYLKRGNLSTRTKEDEAAKNPNLDATRRKMLREMTMQANAQFDQWVKANPVIMDRLRTTANDPARLYFNEVDDLSPLQVPGMNAVDPQSGDPLVLKGYQNAEVRRQARSFGGINGFDVGLGKTFTALAAAQYVQSIGVKKKTMFVVPNTVLSNWRREAGRAYADLSGCMFVGLDVNEKTGKASVDSSNYARDFNRVLENRHNKIFCTLEAFKTIPLRDTTIAAYEKYLSDVDPSFEGGDKNADSERAASKLSDATEGTGEKSSAIPFFEDMGVDSIVMDEAHMFKNSKNTVEFSGAKFLSVAEASQRGLDVQMKAWFVRGLSPLADGVLCLTATPITNSPLEIYSMLCLAVGEEKVHNLCLDARGADAFMNVMCQIEDDEEMTVDGRVKPYRVFRGLQNVDLLRGALATVATIKNAADVKEAGDDLKLPDSPELRAAVTLPENTQRMLNTYKMAYHAARYETGAAAKDTPPPTEEEMKTLQLVTEKFGEPLELVAHPFNLINKMTLLIADPELDDRASFYVVRADQGDKAAEAIAAFNKLGKIEARALAGPWTDEDAVVGTKTVRDGDNETVLAKIKVKAKLLDGGTRIVIDTMDTNIQADFERIAEKAGLDLDCTIPPKLAALLENVRREEASPRSKSGRVKQLIFCDVLPLHNKIKRLLAKHAGYSSSAIVVVSGQSIKNPEQMQGIQDGFNAEGDENKYRVIIANEKAEVGINLQKGTQAIHHLTIGWTPDSTIQRNGRGVRQGNTTDRVNIYHYDADGTFDEYKRTLTSKKADWIGAVMDRQGGNEVAVAGGLTNEQYDELIESMGDAGAVRAIRERAELKERQQRADSARARQVINLKTAQAQKDFLAKFPSSKEWLISKAMMLFDLRLTLGDMRTRAAKATLNANSRIKLETRIAEVAARVEGLARELNAAGTYSRNKYNSITQRSYEEKQSIEEVLSSETHYSVTSKVREAIQSKVRYSVTVVEDSELHQEWASEVSAATSMVAEAVKDFERLAKSDGGYPQELVQAFEEDQVTFLDGKLFSKGMFVRSPGGELLVMSDKARAVKFPGEGKLVTDAVTLGWQFIMFGTPEYEAALLEAARADDAAENVTPDNRKFLYSSIVPAVAQHRKAVTLVGYGLGYYRLPAPHFQYVIDREADLSDGMRALADKQAEIVKGFKGEGYSRQFLAESNVNVVSKSSTHLSDAVERLKALASYAKGSGVKVTVRDVGAFVGTDGASLTMYLQDAGNFGGDAVRAFEGIETEEAVKERGAAMVREAYSWLELPEGAEPSDWMKMGVRVAYNSRLYTLRAEAARRAREEAGGQPAPELTLTSPEAPAPVAYTGTVPPNPRGLIGIKGDTKPNKDIIKAAAKQATGGSGYARWNGAQEQWDVPAATWDYIVSNHPRVAQVLQVVPA